MENLDGYEEPHNLLTNPGLFPKIHASQYPFLPYTNEESSRKPTKWQSEISKPVLLSAFASEEHVRSMACAAWAIVLALYTGREDACFGILIHDGNGWSPETALPIHCERTMPVSRLVARAEDFLNGLYRNVAANCHKIAELRNYLAFVPHSMAGVSSDGLYYSPPHNSALVLSLSLKDQHLSLRSDFDPWVVSPDEIRRAMGHFTQALQHVTSPKLQSLPIWDLDLLTPEDNAQLGKWNTDLIEPVNNYLHLLIEGAAKANPEKPALLYCNESLTYKQLDTMSSNLASQILDGGGSFGDYIPLCMEKSKEMVISMIAVLKANKAFVPLDPAYPKPRRDYILESVQSRTVLVSECVHDLGLFGPGVKESVVSASTLGRQGVCQNCHIPASIGSSRPAYAMFTSGSTGTPKGVIIEHGNVCTSMKEIGRKFDLNCATRMFQYTSYAFDPSILEIFATLIHGGCVCIPTETQRLNDISKAATEMRVNTAVFVPSVLKLLRPEQFPTLKKLIVGGETLTRPLIEIWANKTQLINAYGPTETCVCSLANLSVSTGIFGGNIGTSIACHPWVVNPNNKRQLMPIGAIGELWIEGPTVARGYLGAEAATKDTFVSSLPWSNSGRIHRAYRTGDLVKYFPSGKLLFIGRQDSQVKSNGNRIELEEIEVTICRCSYVADANVQLLNLNDSPILTAFFIPKTAKTQMDKRCNLLSGFEVYMNTLHATIREHLPAHMVPEYLIPVNSIPRMTSGKIDRYHLTGMLKQVHLQQSRSRQHIEEGLPEACRVMRILWAEALEVPCASIFATDRFLHRGGNSIKAMRLVSAARSRGISLHVDEVLRNPTIEDLSQGRDLEIATFTATKLTPQKQFPSPGKYSPTWIQMVSLTTVGAFPEGNFSRIVIALEGRLDLPRFKEACQCLVKQNEVLRTQYNMQGGTIEAIISDEVESPIIRFHSRSEALEHWKSVPQPYLNRPLLELSYVAINDQLTHFALGLQHCQYDAWTVPLLLRQLQSIYHGVQVSLGPHFSSYATRLQLETNPAAEMFWKDQLVDLPMTLLGTGSVINEGPDGHLQQFLHLLPSQFTFATILYTAWALVLSKRVHTRRVVFGSTVSGRNVDMDGILEVVGPCINLIPFVVDVAECVTYHDALQTVQNAMMATVPYEAMPLPDIITRCTKWEPTAVFGSIVQHLDIDFNIPPLPHAEDVADREILEWRYLETIKQYGKCQATDIYIVSTPARDESIHLQLKFNPSRIPPDLAQALFSDLCGHIVASLQCVQQKILV